jgi:hypothetical protein
MPPELPALPPPTRTFSHPPACRQAHGKIVEYCVANTQIFRGRNSPRCILKRKNRNVRLLPIYYGVPGFSHDFFTIHFLCGLYTLWLTHSGSLPGVKSCQCNPYVTPHLFWKSGGGRLCRVVRHIVDNFSIDTAGHLAARPKSTRISGIRLYCVKSHESDHNELAHCKT